MGVRLHEKPKNKVQCFFSLSRIGDRKAVGFQQNERMSEEFGALVVDLDRIRAEYLRDHPADISRAGKCQNREQMVRKFKTEAEAEATEYAYRTKLESASSTEEKAAVCLGGYLMGGYTQGAALASLTDMSEEEYKAVIAGTVS